MHAKHIHTQQRQANRFVNVFLYTRETTEVLILAEFLRRSRVQERIHNPFLSKLFNQPGAFFSR